MGLGGTEDVKVGHEIVKMGKLQPSLWCGLSLRHLLEFSLQMGDSEMEVWQMMLELSELKDFANHSLVINGLDMLK
jgi:hypothetical protein